MKRYMEDLLLVHEDDAEDFKTESDALHIAIARNVIKYVRL